MRNTVKVVLRIHWEVSVWNEEKEKKLNHSIATVKPGWPLLLTINSFPFIPRNEFLRQLCLPNTLVAETVKKYWLYLPWERREWFVLILKQIYPYKEVWITIVLTLMINTNVSYSFSVLLFNLIGILPICLQLWLLQCLFYLVKLLKVIECKSIFLETGS